MMNYFAPAKVGGSRGDGGHGGAGGDEGARVGGSNPMQCSSSSSDYCIGAFAHADNGHHHTLAPKYGTSAERDPWEDDGRDAGGRGGGGSARGNSDGLYRDFIQFDGDDDGDGDCDWGSPGRNDDDRPDDDAADDDNGTVTAASLVEPQQQPPLSPALSSHPSSAGFEQALGPSSSSSASSSSSDHASTFAPGAPTGPSERPRNKHLTFSVRGVRHGHEPSDADCAKKGGTNKWGNWKNDTGERRESLRENDREGVSSTVDLTSPLPGDRIDGLRGDRIDGLRGADTPPLGSGQVLVLGDLPHRDSQSTRTVVDPADAYPTEIPSSAHSTSERAGASASSHISHISHSGGSSASDQLTVGRSIATLSLPEDEDARYHLEGASPAGELPMSTRPQVATRDLESVSSSQALLDLFHDRPVAMKRFKEKFFCDKYGELLDRFRVRRRDREGERERVRGTVRSCYNVNADAGIEGSEASHGLVSGLSGMSSSKPLRLLTEVATVGGGDTAVQSYDNDVNDDLLASPPQWPSECSAVGVASTAIREDREVQEIVSRSHGSEMERKSVQSANLELPKLLESGTIVNSRVVHKRYVSVEDAADEGACEQDVVEAIRGVGNEREAGGQEIRIEGEEGIPTGPGLLDSTSRGKVEACGTTHIPPEMLSSESNLSQRYAYQPKRNYLHVSSLPVPTPLYLPTATPAPYLAIQHTLDALLVPPVPSPGALPATAGDSCVSPFPPRAGDDSIDLTSAAHTSTNAHNGAAAVTAAAPLAGLGDADEGVATTKATIVSFSSPVTEYKAPAPAPPHVPSARILASLTYSTLEHPENIKSVPSDKRTSTTPNCSSHSSSSSSFLLPGALDSDSDISCVSDETCSETNDNGNVDGNTDIRNGTEKADILLCLKDTTRRKVHRPYDPNSNDTTPSDPFPASTQAPYLPHECDVRDHSGVTGSAVKCLDETGRSQSEAEGQVERMQFSLQTGNFDRKLKGEARTHSSHSENNISPFPESVAHPPQADAKIPVLPKSGILPCFTSLLSSGPGSVKPPTGRPHPTHPARPQGLATVEEGRERSVSILRHRDDTVKHIASVSCRNSVGCEHHDTDNGSGSEGFAGSEEDMLCAVCVEPDPWEDDPVMFCEGACGMCVHLKCYGLKNIPRGDFFCEGCKEWKRVKAVNASAAPQDRKEKKPRCVLCRVSSGMMKKSTCGQWVHIICALFTAELTVDEDSMRPNNLQSIDPDRANLQCTRCGGFGGACVQCSYRDCLTAFHPYCAFTSAYTMGARVDSCDCAHYEIFCRKHQPVTHKWREGRPDRSDKLTSVRAEDEGLTNATSDAPIDLSSPARFASPSDYLVDTALKGQKSGAAQPERKRLRRPKQLPLQPKYQVNRPSATIPDPNNRICNPRGSGNVSGGDREGSEESCPETMTRSQRKAEQQKRSKESRKRLKISVGRFFEVEAVISGSDSGDDGEGGDGSDGSDGSEKLSGDFINDGAYTQSSAGCETQQNMYHAVNNALDEDSPGLCR